MNYLIDIIVLVIIALFTFIGYKKGLINVAFKLISFVLAIVISLILYKPLSNFIINKTTLDDKLEVTIQDRLSSDVSKEEKDNILSNYYTHAKNASVGVLPCHINFSSFAFTPSITPLTKSSSKGRFFCPAATRTS